MSAPFFTVTASPAPNYAERGRLRVVVRRNRNRVAAANAHLKTWRSRAQVAAKAVRTYRKSHPEETLPEDVDDQLDRQLAALVAPADVGTHAPGGAEGPDPRGDDPGAKPPEADRGGAAAAAAVGPAAGAPAVDISLTPTPAPGKAGRYLVVAARAGAELYRDVIDLNSGVSRERFVSKAVAAGFPDGGAPTGARRDLGERLLAFARVPPGDPAPPPKAAAAEYTDPRLAPLADTPADVRAEAEQLLADPKLLERVSADIAAAGVVGERDAALTLYLVAISAQLPRPLAAIVTGASSSGKSYLIQTVFGLAPPRRWC